MALFSWNKKTTQVRGYAEQDNSGQWLSYFNQYLSSLNNGELIRYKDELSYELACNIAELFIPIDAIAERVASVPFELVNRNGEPYEGSSSLMRLVSNPNPFDRQSDLVYKMVFSELADGNAYTYTKIPDSLKNPTVDNISNIWVLKPNVTSIQFKKEIPNPFLVKSKNELIDYYKTHFMIDHRIDPRYILHTTALGVEENGRAKSPLTRVRRNIDNILAVYHARYNVYAKNGNAGILSADKVAGGLGIEQAISDPVTRDQIVTDLMNRNGLTGDKNFIGISATPMKFIKTMGTISELEPFEETELNAITIAGIFGLDPELIPRRGSSTFTNKQQAETGLWQNVIKSMCEDKAKDLARAYYLPEGITFKPNFSKVEALQEDKKTALESDSILIGNLAELTLAGQDVSQSYINLTDKYNGA